MWRDGDVVSFRARVVERDVIAINDGHAEVQHMTEAADLAPIREAVRALCADFPANIGGALDRERAYPDRFRPALTEAGFLAALIPEEFGGSGLGMRAAAAIMEEIHASGGNGAACHAQMYTMGTLLRHGSDAQKADYLPGIASGELRLQAFGVTEPTRAPILQHATSAKRDGDHYVVNGQKIWTSRAEHSDLMLLLARTTPRERRIATAGISVFLVDMRRAIGDGLTIRPIRTMMNHATTEFFFENSGPGGESDRRGRRGLSLHPRRHECRAHPHRRRMHRRRALLHRQGRRLCQGARRVRPSDRAESRRAVPARARLCGMRAADLMVGARRPLRGRRALRRGGQHGQTPAAEASWDAADMCLQTHGGFGFAEEFDIERKFRETRLYQVAPISTNLILTHVAEHVSGCRDLTEPEMASWPGLSRPSRLAKLSACGSFMFTFSPAAQAVLSMSAPLAISFAVFTNTKTNW